MNVVTCRSRFTRIPQMVFPTWLQIYPCDMSPCAGPPCHAWLIKQTDPDHAVEVGSGVSWLHIFSQIRSCKKDDKRLCCLNLNTTQPSGSNFNMLSLLPVGWPSLAEVSIGRKDTCRIKVSGPTISAVQCEARISWHGSTSGLDPEVGTTYEMTWIQRFFSCIYFF